MQRWKNLKILKIISWKVLGRLYEKDRKEFYELLFKKNCEW